MDVNKPGPPVTFPVSGIKGEHNDISDIPEVQEYQGSFVASARRCRNLGWRLAAVDARDLVDLLVNFDEPAELWLRQCNQSGPLQGRVNLGVYTGSVSGLVVLEAENGEGESALDRYGSWRSFCRATINGREQHYYTLPAGRVSPPTRYLMAPQVMVFGEEGLVSLPPSVDVHTCQFWRWSNPPWEYPPPELPQCLWNFLEQHLDLAQTPKENHDLLSWEEVYRRITPHEQLLKALLAPCQSLEDHYGNLLQTALEAGFQDEGFLFSLLCHAPQGDASKNPERRARLRHMVREAERGPCAVSNAPVTPASPGHHPEKSLLVCQSHYESVLDDLRALKNKAAELEAVLLNWGATLDANRTPPRQRSLNLFTKPPERCKKTETLVAVVNESLFQVKNNLKTSSRLKDEDNAPPCFHYSEFTAKTQTKAASPEVVEETVNACLKNNPDLAKDPEKLQMIQYFFRNYVSIDPNLSDLSLLERLERASQMVREFLGNQN